MHTHTHTHAHTHTHTRKHEHTCTHTHVSMHVHTQTHTHMQAHTYTPTGLDKEDKKSHTHLDRLKNVEQMMYIKQPGYPKEEIWCFIEQQLKRVKETFVSRIACRCGLWLCIRWTWVRARVSWTPGWGFRCYWCRQTPSTAQCLGPVYQYITVYQYWADPWCWMFSFIKQYIINVRQKGHTGRPPGPLRTEMYPLSYDSGPEHLNKVG